MHDLLLSRQRALSHLAASQAAKSCSPSVASASKPHPTFAQQNYASPPHRYCSHSSARSASCPALAPPCTDWQQRTSSAKLRCQAAQRTAGVWQRPAALGAQLHFVTQAGSSSLQQAEQLAQSRT